MILLNSEISVVCLICYIHNMLAVSATASDVNYDTLIVAYVMFDIRVRG